MNRIAMLGTAASATVVGCGGFLVGPAHATGGAHARTLRLSTHTLRLANTSNSTFAEANTVTKAGKRVGFETLSCNDGGTNVKCSLSLSLPDGMLLGYVTTPITTSSRTTMTGRITGGLGRFTGDKGTVRATVRGKHASYTITYHS